MTSTKRRSSPPDLASASLSVRRRCAPGVSDLGRTLKPEPSPVELRSNALLSTKAPLLSMTPEGGRSRQMTPPLAGETSSMRMLPSRSALATPIRKPLLSGIVASADPDHRRLMIRSSIYSVPAASWLHPEAAHNDSVSMTEAHRQRRAAAADADDGMPVSPATNCRIQEMNGRLIAIVVGIKLTYVTAVRQYEMY